MNISMYVTGCARARDVRASTNSMACQAQGRLLEDPVHANAIPTADDGGVHEVTIVPGSGSRPRPEAGAMGGAARRASS